MTLCIKVKKEKAEPLRKKLLAQGLLDISREVIPEKTFIYFPLKGIKKETAEKLGTVLNKKFKPKTARPHSITEILSKKLSKTELKQLRTSFDLYGEIAVVEIPAELKQKEREIASAFLVLYPKLRAVFKKTSAVAGDYRVRSLQQIAGTGTSETTYKEHGCTYKFDLSKVFFTPRLSTERLIISNQVKPNETIVDAFCGAGPFSILIAKKSQPKHIYAIDINPDAISSLKTNLALNKVSEKITPLCGDFAKLQPKIPEKADRVIMNLPKTDKNFLPQAVKALKQKGIINFYTFTDSEESVRQRISDFLPNTQFELLEIRNVKTYSPTESCFAADILIKKGKANKPKPFTLTRVL
ncbi:MAG: class I SAM-dependent methyltransferase family protein [archaeon]